MRRLFQLGVALLIAAALLTPIFEFFDRWDSAGLANDTEYAVFTFIFALCLVLLLCKLLSSLAAMVHLVRFATPQAEPKNPASFLGHFAQSITPYTSPPLKI